VSFFHSASLPMNDIRDGASNTYMIGEKFMNSESYENGELHGDQFNAFIGCDPEITRYCARDTYAVASRDTTSNSAAGIFGSAHPGSFNMCFCDGSVRQISYAISPVVHDQLGNRQDGGVVDLNDISP